MIFLGEIASFRGIANVWAGEAATLGNPSKKPKSTLQFMFEIHQRAQLLKSLHKIHFQVCLHSTRLISRVATPFLVAGPQLSKAELRSTNYLFTDCRHQPDGSRHSDDSLRHSSIGLLHFYKRGEGIFRWEQ